MMTRDGKPVIKLYAIGKKILNFTWAVPSERAQFRFTAQLRCSGQPLLNEPKGELDYFSQQSGPLGNPGLLMAQTDQSVLSASFALDFHLHVPRRSRKNPLKQEASAGTPDRGDGMFLNVSAEKRRSKRVRTSSCKGEGDPIGGPLTGHDGPPALVLLG